MEEIYIVKLKGLPPPTASPHKGAVSGQQRYTAEDRKAAFYLTTDLTAEAVRGLSYLHIFLGITILCLSVTNLCFNENPWALEPPLGITLWCSLTFVLLGLFGLLVAYQRQCNLCRSIVYVRVYFMLIIVAISVTLTFVILFILDLHGPIANHLIGLNIFFSIIVESIVLILTLFTCARILWPGCMGFCARDWPMQANLKRKVIVKTKVYAGGIENSDEAIQSVGPNCVISLNMPPPVAVMSNDEHHPTHHHFQSHLPHLQRHQHQQQSRQNRSSPRSDGSVSPVTTISSSCPLTSSASTFQSAFESEQRTPSPKLLSGCEPSSTMATSVTTLHTIQSASTVDSGHCEELLGAHHHAPSAHQLLEQSQRRSSVLGLQSAISSQSINSHLTSHPHLGSTSSFPLQTFTKSPVSPSVGGAQLLSATNMNELLYQSTILRRSYLADSDCSLQQSSVADNAHHIYDSDEFDYCTTEDEDEDSADGGDVQQTVHTNDQTCQQRVNSSEDDSQMTQVQTVENVTVSQQRDVDDASGSGTVENHPGDVSHDIDDIEVSQQPPHQHHHHLHHHHHHLMHHHQRALSAAGSDRTSSDEGHGSVDSSDDAKSESNKSESSDEVESVEDLKMMSNVDQDHSDSHSDTADRETALHHAENVDEGIGSDHTTPTSPVASFKQVFVGNYEKCSKIPAPISIPKASISSPKAALDSSHSHKPTIRVLSTTATTTAHAPIISTASNTTGLMTLPKPTNVQQQNSDSGSRPQQVATTTTLLKTYGSKLSSHPYLSRLKATSAIGESAVFDRRYPKPTTLTTTSTSTATTGSATVPDIERV